MLTSLKISVKNQIYYNNKFTFSIYFRSLSQRDLSLNLTASQSDNALKQLKNLTSPLSKFAKGMQNFGMNLDPRKIASKVN